MAAPSPFIPNVGALVSRAAHWHAERIAVLTPTRTLTYRQLEQRSNQLGNLLLGLGLQAGDRVGVYLPNCPAIVELELACYKSGLVKAPINARLSAQEVAAVIANSEASLVLTTCERAEAFLPLLQGQPPRLLLLDAPDTDPRAYEPQLARASEVLAACQVQADDLAVLHYTSGSSGTLKAAMQTYGNRLAQLRKFLQQPDGLLAGDRLGLVGPITHASGMQLVPALCRGATIRLFDRFDPAQYLHEMRADRVTHTFLVPTMIQMLLPLVDGHYLPLPDLRRLGYGAAPMPPTRILQAMDIFGPVLAQGYGAGETTSGVCGLSAQDHLQARAAKPARLASCGRPYLECDVDICNDAGEPVAAGELGEIVVRGPDVFAGYWRAPALSAEVLREGAYYTGDIAYRDDEGYLYIVDRKKDMIITGGFNVYPTEVEAVIYQHPAVAEACVFAVPDDTWGEQVAVHIVRQPGSDCDVSSLAGFCQAQLAGFKRPRRIEFVDSLPRNANGKIARREVQAPYWAGQSRRVN